MNTYDYSILNDKEFEELCRDLISKELNLEFQSFKSGKDGGIDLRYSTSKDDNAVIIQVKQYAKSGYPALKSHLKNKELPKVKELHPKRYIVATSVELSPQQVEEIKEIFSGYIISLQDIYHKNILDRILSENELIERKFYKLWLTSSSVLGKIMHNGSYGMSKLLETDIKANIRKYVESAKHSEAYQKLLNEKIIIITGKPGVGKTTLAKILTYKLLSEKECQLIEINDSIIAASDIIDFNGETKQVIYFDDFLGANLHEIINPRNSEGLIHKFIQRIKTIPGKYLVITSRTTIINKALSRFELSNTAQYSDKKRFVIEIEDYSREEKAKILYNHIFFSNEIPKLKQYVKQEDFFLKIIDHKNYSPRLIEFITGPQYSDVNIPEEYQSQVLYNLNYPKTIWKASYENHLDKYERWVLQTLTTIKSEGKYELVEKLYNERLLFESKSGKTVSSESTFRKSIKNLSGSYLNLSRHSNIESTILNFSNPSIADFLRDYISNDFSILKRLILSSTSTGQLINIYEIFKESYRKNHSGFASELKEFFKKNEKVLSLDYSHEGILNLAFTYFRYFSTEDQNNFPTHLLTKEVLLSGVSLRFTRFHSILLDLTELADVRKVVKEIWDDLVSILYNSAEDEYDYSYVFELFDYYEEDFEEWLENPDNAERVKSSICDYLSDTLHDLLIDETHNLDFNEMETGYYGERDLYITEYSYELKSDIYSKAEDLLDNLLTTMELKDFLSVGDIDIDFEEIKGKITKEYQEHMEYQPYEKDARPQGSGSYAVRSNTDDSIRNLFE